MVQMSYKSTDTFFFTCDTLKSISTQLGGLDQSEASIAVLYFS